MQSSNEASFGLWPPRRQDWGGIAPWSLSHAPQVWGDGPVHSACGSFSRGSLSEDDCSVVDTVMDGFHVETTAHAWDAPPSSTRETQLDPSRSGSSADHDDRPVCLLWREADAGDRTQRHAWLEKHLNLVHAGFSLVVRSGMLHDGCPHSWIQMMNHSWQRRLWHDQ